MERAVRSFQSSLDIKRLEAFRDDKEIELTGGPRPDRRYTGHGHRSVTGPCVDRLPEVVLFLLPLLPLERADHGRRLRGWKGREVLVRQWATEVVLDDVVVLGNVAPVRGRVWGGEPIFTRVQPRSI